MPPTSIFPFIYCFVIIFSILAMLASLALVGFLFNSWVEPKALLGLDWLASLSEPFVPNGFLGWAVVQRSRWSKLLAIQRTPLGGLMSRLLMAPRAKLIKALDMCVVMLEPCALFFINPFRWVLMHSVGVQCESLWLMNGSILLSVAGIGLTASGSNWISEARG